MSRVRCRSRSPAETQAIAEAIAAALAPGDVVALAGELGTGKTCFVQGAARALGVAAPVTSPSFVLVRQYEGRVPVSHIDVYRLGNLQELLDLGYDELLEPTSVIFIEWGDAVDPLLPDEHLLVEFLLGESDERTIVLVPHGKRWSRRMAGLAERLAPWCEG